MPNKCFVPGCRTGYASQNNETEKTKSIPIFKSKVVVFFNCFKESLIYIRLPTINNTFMQIKLFLTL